MVDYGLLSNSSVSAFFAGIYGDWVLLAAALIVLSSGVAAFIYLVGTLLVNDKIKTWAKIEFVEIFYSMVLIALTIGLMGSMNAIVKTIASSDPVSSLVCGTESGPSPFDQSAYYNNIPCHLRLGMHFLNSLFNEGKNMDYDIYSSYIFTSAIAEMNINLEVITEQAGVFAYNPLRGFFVIGNTVKASMFDYVVKIMTINKFQEVMLRAVALAIFPVMFTMGIILRSFFFTRKLGGLLMALAISLYFVFPMFYVAGGMYYNEFKRKAVVASGDPDASALRALYLNMDGFPTLGGPLNADKSDSDSIYNAKAPFDADPYNRNDPYSASATAAMNYLNNPGTGMPSGLDFCKKLDDDTAKLKMDDMESKTTDLVDQLKKKNFYNRQLFLFEVADPGGYIDTASKLTFFSLFFSFLGVMATIAATKSMSGMFGGDLEIAGLTHLI